MAAADYTALDADILKAIEAGARTFAAIQGHARTSIGTTRAFRDIDRRLQALRKRGLIEWSRAGGWQFVEKEG